MTKPATDFLSTFLEFLRMSIGGAALGCAVAYLWLKLPPLIGFIIFWAITFVGFPVFILWQMTKDRTEHK